VTLAIWFDHSQTVKVLIWRAFPRSLGWNGKLGRELLIYSWSVPYYAVNNINASEWGKRNVHHIAVVLA